MLYWACDYLSPCHSKKAAVDKSIGSVPCLKLYWSYQMETKYNATPSKYDHFPRKTQDRRPRSHQWQRGIRRLLRGQSLFYFPHFKYRATNHVIMIVLQPGPRFNTKMSSYQYRKSHCGDKTVVRSSYLHSGISYTGKMTSYIESGPRPYCIIRMTIINDIEMIENAKTTSI